MTVIYINARFLTQPMSGVQRFAAEIGMALAKLRNDIVFLAPNNIVHKEVADKLPIKVIGRNKGTLWEQIDLPIFLKRNGSPTLLCLANTAPMLYSNYLVCHHDITYIRFPETLSRRARWWYSFLMPKVIKNAKKIITVSSFSKKDISSFYNINENDIDVVYNAVSSLFLEKKNRPNKGELYALLVSSVNSHKNINFILNAVKKIDHDMRLKVVGGMAKNFSGVQLIKSKNIEYIGRVTDQELVSLYDNAELFIFPSLYEGFGIPPLEAQARGCLVLSSNAASMPEVLADSAIYFSPYDEKDFIRKFKMLFKSNIDNTKLIEKGYKNVERFSWQESAKKLSSIIDKMADNR